MISQSYSHLLLIYTFLENWRLVKGKDLGMRSLSEQLKVSSNQNGGQCPPYDSR
jgi:hypothetical protein